MTIKVDQTENIFLNKFKFDTVLDVGCGNCRHTDLFRKHGKTVTATDWIASRDDVVGGDYNTLQFEPHDAVWCCHVLEHQLNVNSFLTKLVGDCREGGVIAITVPPLKHQVVGGHVTLWNAGTLLYNLILAGVDCSKASVGTYGYNHSVVVEKKSITLPKLKYDQGDIETLSKFFPVPARQGFNGQKINVRWS